MSRASPARIAVLLLALLAGATAGFVRLAERNAAPRSDGATQFAAYCANCHAAAELRVTLRHAATDRRALLHILEGHGDAAAEDDEAIVDYLLLSTTDRR